MTDGGGADPDGQPRPAQQAANDPAPARLWQRAVSLYQAGRWREAMAVCRNLLAAVPKQPAVLGLAGLVALQIDNAAEAVALLTRAVELRPDAADLHYNLANALRRLGRVEEAVAVYRRAASYGPDLLPIRNNLGAALQSLGRHAEAAEAFRYALRLAPNDAELHRNLGIALEGDGKLDGAIAAYRRALALKPGWPQIYRNLTNALLTARDARGTIALCDAWLDVEPGAIEAIGLKAVALDEIGDRAGARHLVDLDRFLRQAPVTAPPPGYASLDAFNAALAQHLLADPTLAAPAQHDVHYHGPAFRTTGELFDRPSGPLVALESLIKTQIADYLAAVATPSPDHPYLARPPRRWRVIAQATVLDRTGNLAPHVHYSGYVSGVYYVRIPAFVTAAQADHAGWFEIGRPPPRFHHAGRPEARFIEPREGMMLLFPSYFYHSTVPFDRAETRISVAFDACPEAA
jgi:Flp pilus assembly protein TadD